MSGRSEKIAQLETLVTKQTAYFYAQGHAIQDEQRKAQWGIA